jgi:hypothetical protein
MRRRFGLGDVTSSATAAASQYAAVPANASAAISQGQSLYTAAAGLAGGNGPAGFAAAASGLIQGLPSGTIKAAVSQVESLVGDASGGAALGTAIWPGIGTAVGAAVGLIVGELSQIFGGAPPVPAQGEFRSTAEKYVFPSVNPSDPTAPPSVVPVIWPGTRPTLVGYLEAGDTYTSATPPLPFNFGVTWVSPPGSTTDSQHQALQVAQAWIAQNNVTTAALKGYDNTPKILQSWMLPSSSAAGKAKAFGTDAGIALASQNLVTSALALLTRWYGGAGAFNVGQNPWTKYTFEIPGVTDENGVLDSSMLITGGNITADLIQASVLAFQTTAQVLNQFTSLDFLYYTSDRFLMEVSTSPSRVTAIDPAFYALMALVNCQVCQCVDTLLIALAEIAVLVVTGIIPSAAADLVVFHYVAGLQWVWMQAQKEDQQAANPGAPIVTPGGPSDFYLSPTQHPNFARVLGIVGALVSKAQTQTTTTAVKVAQQKATAAAVAKTSAATAGSAASALATALGTRSAEAAGQAAIVNHVSTNPTTVGGEIVTSAQAGLTFVNGEWKKIASSSTDKAVTFGILGAAALGGLLLWRKR